MDTYELLFSLVGNFDEDDVSAIRELVGELCRERKWLIGAPEFVDNLDADSCTHPSDEPIRTVGGYLILYKPSSPPHATVERAELGDVEYLIDKLATFSRERHCELEIELGGEYIGDIVDGVVGTMITMGLVNEWRKLLEQAANTPDKRTK